MARMRVERLDHPGIVAGVCREIGLAEYLDALAGPSGQQVSVGTAAVAMVLKRNVGLRAAAGLRLRYG
jgi:hypothetical protein